MSHEKAKLQRRDNSMRIRYIVALFLAISTASAQGLYRMEKSADAMGATFTVALFGTDRAAMEAAIDAALAAAGVTDPAKIEAANAAITLILTPARPGIAERN